MTFVTQTADIPAPVGTAGTTASDFRSRTAALLAWLARRVERGAQARARRKAARMRAAELSRLPESVRMELGVNHTGARRPSAFVQGLVGPAAYWAPSAGYSARGDAKN
jgi:hypothetical protein